LLNGSGKKVNSEEESCIAVVMGEISWQWCARAETPLFATSQSGVVRIQVGAVSRHPDERA